MKKNSFTTIIAKELGLTENVVKNTLDLLESGATIPFIARYRKESTGSLDEVQIACIRDMQERLVELEKRRAYILDAIEAQEKLTPELRKKIENADKISDLEDLYLPYKPKRQTKASIAIQKGLEPLAVIIYEQQPVQLDRIASQYIDLEKGVNSAAEALQGARHIIAEWISEDKKVRDTLRSSFSRYAVIYSKVAKGKEEAGAKFENYFKTQELTSKIPSHRILAMFRGENEDILKLSIYPDPEPTISNVKKVVVRNYNSCSKEVVLAAEDAYQRLLQPQMETEMRNALKEKADKEAIAVFSENLRQLLMAPPLGQKNVLALDPGFRTGCKLVVLNRQGKLLHHDVIYCNPPVADYKKSSDTLYQLVEKYEVEAIAIGNGTASRETENFVKMIPFSHPINIIVVNENGASIYSASELARQEFPHHDVTVRGAVSIGRRLMDPLAELVKIDPKSIGVGQYQHDVNKVLLQKKLQEVVESCVNRVGVELNTASAELLSYVSGVGPSLAKNIVAYRDANGAFKSRKELKKVARFGDKAFEQAAGFLRIHHAKNMLDTTAVHPESYSVVEKMCQATNTTVEELIRSEEARKQINLVHFISDKVGLPTLRDIMQELEKPGRDPREEYQSVEFDNSIHSIEDLIPGMTVPGVVTNITNFGCFVDIGVHQDGLVHVSQMANKFVKDPNTIVKLRQKVTVKVTDVDVIRKRINLSMKLD